VNDSTLRYLDSCQYACEILGVELASKYFARLKQLAEHNSNEELESIIRGYLPSQPLPSSGLVTRGVNADVSIFDSEGRVTIADVQGLGGASNIRTEALRPDGSPGGVFGELTVWQDHAARQFASPVFAQPSNFAANGPDSKVCFNICDPPADYE
jgi:hypothetical protein